MAWELTGNSGTDPANNFLGTTDNQPLVIKVNGEEALRISPKGDVGIRAGSTHGDLTISGAADPNIGWHVLTAPGRLHIAGEEKLFLLNKGGVIVGNEWGGNGNLTVEGVVAIGGGSTHGDLTISGAADPNIGWHVLTAPGRLHIAGEEKLFLLNKGGVIV